MEDEEREQEVEEWQEQGVARSWFWVEPGMEMEVEMDFEVMAMEAQWGEKVKNQLFSPDLLPSQLGRAFPRT